MDTWLFPLFIIRMYTYFHQGLLLFWAVHTLMALSLQEAALRFARSRSHLTQFGTLCASLEGELAFKMPIFNQNSKESHHLDRNEDESGGVVRNRVSIDTKTEQVEQMWNPRAVQFWFREFLEPRASPSVGA